MQINNYNKVYNEYFTSIEFNTEFKRSLELIKNSKKIFFIGNGGSNAICSHMMEDFAKVARRQSFSFSDAALITCFSNDYGYEQAIKEWLSVYMEKDDLLFAISSSGNSLNINNATDFANEIGANIITLTGFEDSNLLNGKGLCNFHIKSTSYGIVECFHQVVIHALLDEYTNQ